MMSSRLLRPVLAAALGLLALPLLAAPASAASTGVLAAQWSDADDAGGVVNVAASVTVNTSGGATFAAGKQVTLSPPTGATFTAGTHYAVGPRTATVAGISQYGFSACASRTWTGSIDVTEASYDGTGTLTSLAATYHATCAWYPGGSRTATIDGTVRFGSSASYAGLTATSTPVTVAIGATRPVTVTFTSHGPGTVALGAASIAGTHASNYAVSANGCAGKTLSDGQSCDVTLAYSPATASGGETTRPARLDIATPGHLGGTFGAGFTNKAVLLPTQPQVPTTFPVSGGLGVAWQPPTTGADSYHVERRADASEPWTEVATVSTAGAPAGGMPLHWVDTSIAPGGSADYRVSGDNSGWTGPGATTSGARAAADPAVGGTSAAAWADTDPGTSPVVLHSTDPGTTFVAQAQGRPTLAVQRTVGSTVTSATFELPPVPGPGLYRLPSGQATEPFCGTLADSWMQVRSVLFDTDLTPLLYDASWTGRCADGHVVHAEIRLGAGGDLVLPTATPATPLTTYASKPVTTTVTLGNHGPDPVQLGAAAPVGPAAADWSVTDDGCAGAHLASGDTCPVTVRFATAATGDRSVDLEIPASGAAGPLAPDVVRLPGRGATVPTVPSLQSASGLLDGAQLTWTPPSDDGGFPVTGYQAQRRPAGTTGAWTSFDDMPASARRLWDPSVPDGTWNYRLRAVSEVGAGDWLVVQLARATTGGVSDAPTSAGEPHQLVELPPPNGPSVPGLPQPMNAPDGYDYRDPAVSSGGGHLVFARSAAPGAGTDGEYDLYASTVRGTFGATPATPVRLTSLPGAERDPDISPDSREVAFTSTAPDGSRSVQVVPLAGGTPTLVLAGAADPAWDMNGNTLVVADPAGGPLRRVTLDGANLTPLAGTDGGTAPAVSRDGTLAYVDASGDVATLAPGAASPVVRASTRAPYRRPAWTADGQLIATDRTDTAGAVDGSREYASLAGLGGVAPAVRDTDAPTLTVDPLDPVVKGTQTLGFTVGDGPTGTLPSALRVQCRLDAGSWTPCISPQTWSGLSDGRHDVRVRATDEGGNTTTSPDYTFLSDVTAPTVALTGPTSAGTLATNGRFTWHADGTGSLVTTYDVRWERVLAGHLESTWQTTHTTAAGFEHYLNPGDELCAQVRAHDQAGFTSGWTGVRCVGRAVDDADLKEAGGFRMLTTRAGWQQSLDAASRKGATLSSWQPVAGRRFAVLAQTLPGGGAVAVYVGRHYIGTAHLGSTRTTDRVWVSLPEFPNAVAGTLRLVTTSASPVRVDGVLVRQH